MTGVDVAAIRADMRRRRLWVLWTRMLGASWLVLAAWLTVQFLRGNP